MATLLAHIRVRPGMEARFEQLATELFQATHANERAVRRYEYFRGTDLGTYYALLSFDDFHGFLDHQSSDHHEAAAPGLGEVTESTRFEWVDPIQQASPLSADGPPAATGRRISGRHALPRALRRHHRGLVAEPPLRGWEPADRQVGERRCAAAAASSEGESTSLPARRTRLVRLRDGQVGERRCGAAAASSEGESSSLAARRTEDSSAERAAGPPPVEPRAHRSRDGFEQDSTG